MDDLCVLLFTPFKLDLGAACLWREQTAVRLTAKAFAVLRYLATHPGRLVTKREIFDTVWALPVVSEAALTACIGEIRRALGDAAQQPQFLETVRGRGYRFLAPVTRTASALVPLSPSSLPRVADLTLEPPGLLVGREAELAQLQHHWQQAQQGVPQLVCVTGEAGIGKTALVDAFVAQALVTSAGCYGRGQCIEQYGAGEAYLPIFALLAQMARGAHGPRVLDVLTQQAPTWLVQMPGLLPAMTLEALQQRTRETTRERMLRELADAIETLSVERPLLLLLEDLHWCDASTLDWLGYIGRRRSAARLLVLGTYRPTEALVQGHPIHRMTQELVRHGQGAEIVLGYLSAAEVVAYVRQRFGVLPQLEPVAQTLAQRTDGNPLFLTAVVDELVQQGTLRQGEAGWSLVGELEALRGGVPETLQHLVERQFAQLSPDDQRLLAVASVVGSEFAAATVAAAIDATIENVERRCDALARQGQFLLTREAVVWPNGTLTAQYGFRHALYHDVLYAQVAVNRRAHWHRQIGACLETAYGPQRHDIATALSEHFRRGQDTQRAVQYLQYAGENAQRRHAHRETIGHLTTALTLLATLPATPERDRQELALRTPLGTAWLALKGWPAPEVWHSLHPALGLAQSLGQREALLPIYYGLASNVLTQGRIAEALIWGQAMLEAAEASGDAELSLVAHRVACMTRFWRGDFAQACWHGERVLAQYNATQHHHIANLVHTDPKSMAGSYGALATWMLGYPDRAAQMIEASTAHARWRAHPFDLGSILALGGLLWAHCGDPVPLLACAEEAEQLGRRHSLPFIADVLAQVLKGGAWLRAGCLAAGIPHMRQAIATYNAHGNEVAMPYFRAILAEGLALSGDDAGALQLLETSLTQIARPGWEEHCHLAEILRLKGWLLERQGDPDGAQQHYLTALDWARRQQAKAWELRAATSLARLWQAQGKPSAAQALLAPIYHWFTEGFGTRDVTEARVLLRDLAGV